jgi:ABC-type multidrug transport system fused ATPase/permease subunit
MAMAVPPTAESILSKWKANPSHKLSRSEKRILKKEFFLQMKQLRKSIVQKDMDATGRTLLIIFTLIMAIGAAGLLALLVCQLSCNGAAFAATAVSLLGGVGLILSTIFVIKAINKKYRQSQTNKTNTTK